MSGLSSKTGAGGRPSRSDRMRLQATADPKQLKFRAVTRDSGNFSISFGSQATKSRVVLTQSANVTTCPGTYLARQGPPPPFCGAGAAREDPGSHLDGEEEEDDDASMSSASIDDSESEASLYDETGEGEYARLDASAEDGDVAISRDTLGMLDPPGAPGVAACYDDEASEATSPTVLRGKRRRYSQLDKEACLAVWKEHGSSAARACRQIRKSVPGYANFSKTQMYRFIDEVSETAPAKVKGRRGRKPQHEF